MTELELMHIPVLFDEVFSYLTPSGGEVAVDCTVGLGGHAAEIAARVGPSGRIIGFDLDPANLASTADRLQAVAVGRVDLVESSYSTLGRRVRAGEFPVVDCLLADLGFASNQMDDPERGFSFMYSGPLDMRLGPSVGPSARALVNEWDEEVLAEVIAEFGEERRARPIARAIVRARREHPIETTAELAEVVRGVFGIRPGRQPRLGRGKIDPATRTFMALRIAVNHELDHLQELLADLPEVMGPGGRVVMISFHSLEDRPIKQAMRFWEQAGWGRRLSRRVVVADEAERCDNPRSRSAKLRAFVFESPISERRADSGRSGSTLDSESEAGKGRSFGPSGDRRGSRARRKR